MSGFSITLDDAKVRARLRDLAQDLADLTPAMQGIGQTLVTESDLAFREQRDPWGKAWAGLRAVTLARRRQGPNQSAPKAQILVDSGRLRNSINARADAHSVAVGTNVGYAATHQFGAARGAFGRTRRGAPIPWGKIPARPFLPIRSGQVDLPPDLLADILDIVRHHLEASR